MGRRVTGRGEKSWGRKRTWQIVKTKRVFYFSSYKMTLMLFGGRNTLCMKASMIMIIADTDTPLWRILPRADARSLHEGRWREQVWHSKTSTSTPRLGTLTLVEYSAFFRAALSMTHTCRYLFVQYSSMDMLVVYGSQRQLWVTHENDCWRYRHITRWRSCHRKLTPETRATTGQLAWPQRRPKKFIRNNYILGESLAEITIRRQIWCRPLIKDDWTL